jgi:tetratricopeptide (TPR) repeat protein
VLAGLQDADGSEAAFREALRLNPADTFARSQLGWSLLQRGKSYAAVVAAEEGLADAPDDARLLELLAAAEMGIFDFPNARRTVAHALSIHPHVAAFHYQSGLLLKRATRWCQSGLPSFEAVIAAHAEAVRLSPSYEPYQEALEQARQMLAQFQEELPHLPADPLPGTEEDGEDAPPEPDDLAAEAAEYHSELLAGSDGDAQADDYQPLPLTRWARRVDRCRMWLGVGCVVVAWGGGTLVVVVYGLLHLVKALGG